MNNLEELYTMRILVFLETEPQSNKYYQVMLDEDQFKKVSDAITVRTKKSKDLKEGYVKSWVNTSEQEYPLPDLQEIV